MTDLSIIIVNWNTQELLRNCLASIFSGAGDLSLELFVVDNHSSDNSAAMVREQFPQVRLIENQENVGFAAANNQVFPFCSADQVLLLNPDTLIRGDTFQVLARFMAEHPEAGAVGPKVVHPDKHLRVLPCGYQPTVRTLFNQYFFLASLFPHWSIFRGINLLIGVHDDRTRSVEWLSGVCLLVRRQVIEQVGPLSTDWFMYAEDMEWCRRMTAAGWKLYHLPEATIEHHLGASTAQNKAVETMWIRNLRSYFIQSEQPSRLRLLLFDTILIAGLVLRAGLYRLRGLVDRRQRALWQAEANKFAAYATTAMEAFKAS